MDQCQGRDCINTARKGSLFCRPCADRLGVGVGQDTLSKLCTIHTCGRTRAEDSEYCTEHSDIQAQRKLQDKAMMYACRVMAEAIVIYAEPDLLSTIMSQWNEIELAAMPQLMIEIEDVMRDFSAFLYTKEDEIYQAI